MSEMPDDQTIMRVVAERRSLPTYVLKNWLRGEGFKSVTTPWLRRQLVRLSKSGRVERDERAEYGQNHCWRLPASPTQQDRREA